MLSIDGTSEASRTSEAEAKEAQDKSRGSEEDDDTDRNIRVGV